MSIYNIAGQELQEAYTIQGNALSQAFDLSGNPLMNDPYLENRLLIFEDNFSGDTINNAYWTVEVGHNGGKSYSTKRRQNASVRHGVYSGMLKKEDYLDKYTWTASGITTRGKKSWVYGRFEAKMKVAPAFNNAFYLFGNNFRLIYPNDDETYDYLVHSAPSVGIYNWPQCGEIDIVESWSYNQKSQPQCNLWNYTGTSISHGTFPTAIDTVNNWHVYALERTRDLIIAYIDNIEYKRWDLTQLDPSAIQAYIDTPMAIILAIGIGDDRDEERMTQAQMLVDWVRVYAPAGVSSPILPESISIQNSIRQKKGYSNYMVYHILPVSATNLDAVWNSDDESICHCANGVLYCDEVGETDIHVTTVNGLSATCHVTVVEPEDY